MNEEYDAQLAKARTAGVPALRALHHRKNENAMYLRKITHLITVLFILLCALVCPVPQLLCEEWLDYDLEHCIKKRHSHNEFGLLFSRILQKSFNRIISVNNCFFTLPFFPPLHTGPAPGLSSAASTILLL
jgi:hypothetical protein